MKVFKKCVLLISCLSLVGVTLAEDFRENTNPFKKYEYKNEFAWQQEQQVKQQQPVTYFSNSISNPLVLRQSKKYQNLVNSSQSLYGCWDKAGAAYGVDPWLLFAYAKVESSFNRQATNVNKNKTVDLGMMQINSSWLPTLRKFGIDTKDLFDPCTSVFVGAWIVAQNIRKFGYNQDGIGAYNSPGNITIRRNYARKVYAAYNELTHDFVNVSYRN